LRLAGQSSTTGAVKGTVTDSGGAAVPGATVTLVDEDTDAEMKFQIVGDLESDAKKGRISISSPIARALIGKTKGDTVEVAAPGGARSYEILKVQFV
jgi:transcription elongation factor GreA